MFAPRGEGEHARLPAARARTPHLRGPTRSGAATAPRRSQAYTQRPTRHVWHVPQQLCVLFLSSLRSSAASCLSVSLLSVSILTLTSGPTVVACFVTGITSFRF